MILYNNINRLASKNALKEKRKRKQVFNFENFILYLAGPSGTEYIPRPPSPKCDYKPILSYR